MAWSDSQSLLSTLLQPTPLAIVLTALVVISIPLFLHLVIYRSTSSTTLSSFLLVGPSGSGKTSLLTLVWSLYFGSQHVGLIKYGNIVGTGSTWGYSYLSNAIKRGSIPSSNNHNNVFQIPIRERPITTRTQAFPPCRYTWAWEIKTSRF